MVENVNIKEFGMHDDRFDIPTRDQLIEALDKLLETPRAENNGGWPDVSFERMYELDEFFRTVRKAVFAPDPDGASVITWEMTHRAHHFNFVNREIRDKADLRAFFIAKEVISLVGNVAKARTAAKKAGYPD